MPFEKGTFALSIFRLPEDLPENYIQRFAANNAGSLDDVDLEPTIGWVSGRHLLETTISEDTIFAGGGFPYMYLRTAERKIPATLLNAMCKFEELAYMNAEGKDFLSSKEKKLIREDLIEQNIKSFYPTITGTPFVIDTNTNMLYLGTGSLAQVDTFIALFMKTLNIEPLQVNAKDIMFREFNEEVGVLPAIKFSEKSEMDSDIGLDFLTWLWYESDHQGMVDLDNYGPITVWVDGPLTFSFGDEPKGSGETTVKKGTPQRSAEALMALEVGKKLKKAKVMFHRDEDCWSATFDAEKFTFSAFQLPDGTEMDPTDKFSERITNLHIFNLTLQAFFKKFAETLKNNNWDETESKIQKWVEEKDKY